MDLGYLERLRLQELEAVLPHLPRGARVLEIGAGTGAQARELDARGWSAEAVDLASSPYAGARVFPVRDYDGRTLPFPDGSFDVVFSSNALEHIRELDAFLAETRRVLRSGGIAIHVLPTTTWRLWTTLALYALRPWQRARPELPGAPTPTAAARERRGLGALCSRRHGEHGNAWSELYLFSRYRWRSVFRRARFALSAERPSRLFYTGCSLLGDRVTLSTRRRLSRMLGSSSRVWILSRV
jgi:SAM-dependent methyltransferase